MFPQRILIYELNKYLHNCKTNKYFICTINYEDKMRAVCLPIIKSRKKTEINDVSLVNFLNSGPKTQN